MEQNSYKKSHNKILIYIGIILILAITTSTGWFVKYFTKFLLAILPILGAFAIAFFMEPMILFIRNRFFKKYKKSFKYATFTSYLIVGAIIYLLFYLFSKPLLYDIQAFIDSVSSKSFVVNLSEKIDSLFNVSSYDFLLKSTQDLKVWFDTNINQILIWFFNRAFAGLFEILFIIAAAVYISMEYGKFKKWVHKKMAVKHSFLVKTLDEIAIGIKAWSRGWVKDQSFIFTSTIIFLYLLGVESFVTLSVIMTVFNFVPFFGPIIGGGLIWIYILATYVSTTAAPILFGTINLNVNTIIILVGVGIIVIQSVESLYIVPRVYSNEIQLKPLTILLSLSIIATIFSPLLTPLTMPIIVIGRAIRNTIIENRQNSKKYIEETNKPKQP